MEDTHSHWIKTQCPSNKYLIYGFGEDLWKCWNFSEKSNYFSHEVWNQVRAYWIETWVRVFVSWCMQFNEAFNLFSALSWCILICIKFMTWSYVNSSVLWFLFIEFIISKSSTHVQSDCSHFNTALLKLLNRVERKLHHIQSLNDLLCHFHLSFLSNLFITSSQSYLMYNSKF